MQIQTQRQGETYMVFGGGSVLVNGQKHIITCPAPATKDGCSLPKSKHICMNIVEMVHSAYFVPRLQSRRIDSVHSTISLHSSSVNNFAHFKVTISHWHCVYMRTSIRISVYICIRICVVSIGGIVSR